MVDTRQEARGGGRAQTRGRSLESPRPRRLVCWSFPAVLASPLFDHRRAAELLPACSKLMFLNLK